MHGETLNQILYNQRLTTQEIKNIVISENLRENNKQIPHSYYNP